ncbi:putative oxidoreductase [Corynascus novoguineensis]|uniref:Oxidoreductase n=1 Tax=Corynascus novoguineensis TaxID=1126955 RepID=A0AAN7HLJ3_9PEZI|nr:putative oxidoreductase [Corynascus novoguineensis]
MPSYAITGVSKGIGFEFLRQYSNDPKNVVIGIVRDKAATLDRVSQDSDLKNRQNIHILQADLVDYDSLQAAVVDVAAITGGSLDCLIANAALVKSFGAYDPIGVLGEQPELVAKSLREQFEVNVIGNVHLFNLFVPLILKGQAKKVIFITSGIADPEFTRKYDVAVNSLYAAAKGAMNVLVAKYSAQYRKDGVLFLALCPGLVDTGHFSDTTPEQLEKVQDLMATFARYAPHFKGPKTPEQSVTAMRSVIANAIRYAASKSLAIFGRDPAELGNVLMRIALVKNTASATALFRSILALSSLHRHGIHSRAIELKISAIKALAAASGSSLDAVEAMQHVAAGMLLSSFETHQATCTSGDWTRYLRGAKHVIDAAGLDELPHDDDLAALLDWVYYQDVLSRFSVRHWHRDAQGKPAAESDVESVTGTLRAKPSKAAPPALRLIELLSDVCDIISNRILEATSTDENKSYLRILEWRIRTMAISTTADDDDDEREDATLITELYRLATLLYLHRASFEMSWPATRTQQLLDRGFCLLAQLGACDRQFPIFVLGCEARSDEQRAVVLDLITRTERGPSSRSFNYTRAMLQAVWAQDDLAVTSREIGYLDKMSYVISCCKNLPTFA